MTKRPDLFFYFNPNITVEGIGLDLVQLCCERCPQKDECVGLDGKVSKPESEDKCTGYYSYYDTYSLINRCIPDIDIDDFKGTAIYDTYEDLINVFTASVSDIMTVWWIFLVAAALALVLSFVFMCCFRCLGKCIIWTIIILCLIVVFVIGAILLITGILDLKDAVETEKTNCYVFIGFGAAILLAGLIMLFIVIGLHNRISLAVALVQESSKVLASNCCLIIVPIVYVVLFLVCVVLLVITMVFYFSSLNVTCDAQGSRDLEFTYNTRFVMIFMLLMFFWAAFFIIGMSQSTVAGAAAEWYFTYNKEDDLPTFPIARSLKILILHHLGSVSVGSCLIAIICVIRTIVLYFQKKLKESQNPDQQPMKCLLSCLQCCLGCLQKIVQYITSKAYIMMMIYGKGFFHSAIDAVKLLLRNFLRASLLSGISRIVIFSAIIAVTLLSGFICVLIIHPELLGFDNWMDDHNMSLCYWWFIALICFIVAFVVAFIIMEVYDSLIDTIFLCFLQDEEVASTDSNYHPFASENLRVYFDGVKNRAEESKRQSTPKATVQIAV